MPEIRQKIALMSFVDVFEFMAVHQVVSVEKQNGHYLVVRSDGVRLVFEGEILKTVDPS